MNLEEYKKILSDAIGNEIEAHEFYKSAAGKSTDKNLKTIFIELAEEELKHKLLLEKYLKDDSVQMSFKNVTDYKVSESVELPKLTSSMSFSDGVALAMKKEEEAMIMYQTFAEASIDTNQKNTFLQLATMERMHKVRLEDLYTNSAYTESW